MINFKELKKNISDSKLSKVKSQKDIKKEISLCKKYWTCRTDYYYYHYELYNKNLSEDDLLDYVPPFYFANAHQERYMRGLDIVKLSNKFEQYKIFHKYNIPTPKIEGIIVGAKLYNLDYSPISLDKLELLFQTYESLKLFVKPVGNCGGFGIRVAHSLDELIKIVQNSSKKDLYIIQQGLKQNSDINIINDSCVNTLRVIVHEENNMMKMKLCILRMGRNNSEVDNSAQGGISIVVDINNGSFADYATAEHGGGKYYSHPDSNYQFKNNKINNWDYIMKQIEEEATKIKFLKDIALDVAITEDGISFIEYNFNYGIDHLQKTFGGVRKILNVYPKENRN